jgi:hypothetical protein
VFASRDGAVWSAAAAAGPVVLTPEVHDLRLATDGRSVSATWRAPAGAAEVLAVRQDLGRAVPGATLHGFSDAAVQTDVTYRYRIAAVYLDPEGARHESPGLVAAITPELPPAAVTDLEAAVLADLEPLVVQATWTPPKRGTVRIALGTRPPGQRPGTVVPLTDAAALGRELPGVPERLADGRARLLVPVPGGTGRCVLTAVTLGRSEAVVGSSVELTVTSPVRGLTARRFTDVVRLSWVWPPDSTVARVRWRGGAEGDAECLRRRYDDQGGFEVAVGPAAVTISVQAVMQRPDGEVTAPAVEVDVEGLPATVRYRIQRDGLLRRRTTLVVEADRPCEAPALTLVRRPGSVQPLRPDQGAAVATVPAQRLEPGQPVVLELALPPGRARLRLFAQGAGGVTLLDPPAAELEVG